MEPTLIEFAKPAIEFLISSIIKPKIEKLCTKINVEYNKIMIPRGEHFSEYLHRAYKKYSQINTLALMNSQSMLKDIYQPLTLINILDDNSSSYIVLDKYPLDLAKNYRRILITDTAGMGKSTLSKRLFIDAIDNGHGIPIFIELRRLSKSKNILQEIHEQIDSLTKDFNSDLLLELIQTGGFIFFFDGYDEIPSENKYFVSHAIQSFVEKSDNNTFFLTSRPEPSLVSFGSFKNLSIVPLKKKEAYELLRKYDKSQEISSLLIEKLKSGDYSMVDEYLKNPLLVSLLYTAFEHKQTIPLKKHIFYRQVYDAYFERHDLSKGGGYSHEKKSNLDIDDFESVLRKIGFECLLRHKVEFTKDELLDIINKAKEFVGHNKYGNSDFLDDLLCSVPLFCMDGIYYKWVHKSLQEYFAAQYIYKDSKNNQDSILKYMVMNDNIDRFSNLLDIYYDIDEYSFNELVVLPLLKEYLTYYKKNKVPIHQVPDDLIDARLFGLFRRMFYMVSDSILGGVDKLEVDFVQIKSYIEGEMRKNKKTTDLEMKVILHRSNEDYLCAVFNEPKQFLWTLILKKNPEIFNEITRNKQNNLSIGTSEYVEIDITYGATSSQKYDSVNNLIYQAFMSNTRHLLYLNISSCANKVSEIQKSISTRTQKILFNF